MSIYFWIEDTIFFANQRHLTYLCCKYFFNMFVKCNCSFMEMQKYLKIFDSHIGYDTFSKTTN